MINTPDIDKGITARTINARLNELNWTTIAERIRINERIIAKRIDWTDFAFSSFTAFGANNRFPEIINIESITRIIKS